MKLQNAVLGTCCLLSTRTSRFLKFPVISALLYLTFYLPCSSTLAMATIDYDPYDALLHHVYQQVSRILRTQFFLSPSYIRDQTQGEAWFRPAEEHIPTGVCLRTEMGHFRVFPYNNALLAPFEAAVRLLNPSVAVKVRSAAVHAAFSTM